MNASEFMGTYRSGPASENTYACIKCGSTRHRNTEGSDTACSTPSSSGSDTSSFSVDDIVAGILECLGKADGLWLSRGEILLLIARTKGGA